MATETRRNQPRVRSFAGTFYRQPLENVAGQTFVNLLLSGCDFSKVKDTKFINCDLGGSHLNPQSIHDLLGLTITLDCYSFDGLEVNELALSSILFLLTKTRGNDEMRKAILEVIPEHRRDQLARLFEVLGR